MTPHPFRCETCDFRKDQEGKTHLAECQPHGPKTTYNLYNIDFRRTATLGCASHSGAQQQAPVGSRCVIITSCRSCPWIEMTTMPGIVDNPDGTPKQLIWCLGEDDSRIDLVASELDAIHKDCPLPSFCHIKDAAAIAAQARKGGYAEGAAAERERVINAAIVELNKIYKGYSEERHTPFEYIDGAQTALDLIEQRLESLRSQPEKQNDVVNFSLMPVPESHAFKRINMKTEPECGACTGPDPLDVLETLYDLHEKIAIDELSAEEVMGSIEQIMEDIPNGMSFGKYAELRQQGRS